MANRLKMAIVTSILTLHKRGWSQRKIAQELGVRRPKFRKRDRGFWVWLSRIWQGWRSALVIVRPATVVKWHRQGFKFYWRWKSRKKPGRPPVDRKIRDLIRRMSREDPTWAGASQIDEKRRQPIHRQMSRSQHAC